MRVKLMAIGRHNDGQAMTLFSPEFSYVQRDENMEADKMRIKTRSLLDAMWCNGYTLMSMTVIDLDTVKD